MTFGPKYVIRESFIRGSTVYSVCRAVKIRNVGVLLPMIPLSFVVAYRYDMVHGNKMDRILGEYVRNDYHVVCHSTLYYVMCYFS